MSEIETTIYDFKTHLSRYIQAMEQGEYERIIVKRRDKPVGEFTLTPPDKQSGIRFGSMRGAFEFDKELFDSGDKEIEDAIYEEDLWDPNI